MKFSEIQSKSREELEEMLRAEQVKLGQLTFERVRKTLKKSSDLDKTKKLIAQINTALHGN